MIKIGFFVEGQTERIFLEKLIHEYLTPPKFDLESVRSEGDGIVTIRKPIKHKEAEVYILIHEAVGGERVVGALVSRAEKMIDEAQFNCLIALRDLFPTPFCKKKDVIQSVQNIFNQYSFSKNLKHVLAIMEIEAWFLADYKMFEKIDTQLTPVFINKAMDIDIINENPESFEHPAAMIDRIFRLIGQRYKKRKDQSYQIAYRLDYNFLCADDSVRRKAKSFSYLLDCINEGLRGSEC